MLCDRNCAVRIAFDIQCNEQRDDNQVVTAAILIMHLIAELRIVAERYFVLCEYAECKTVEETAFRQDTHLF